MNWFRWFLVVLFALQCIGEASIVGQPRHVCRPKDAAFTFLINICLILGVVFAWGGCK